MTPSSPRTPGSSASSAGPDQVTSGLAKADPDLLKFLAASPLHDARRRERAGEKVDVIEVLASARPRSGRLKSAPVPRPASPPTPRGSAARSTTLAVRPRRDQDLGRRWAWWIYASMLGFFGGPSRPPPWARADDTGTSATSATNAAAGLDPPGRPGRRWKPPRKMLGQGPERPARPAPRLRAAQPIELIELRPRSSRQPRRPSPRWSARIAPVAPGRDRGALPIGPGLGPEPGAGALENFTRRAVKNRPDEEIRLRGPSSVRSDRRWSAADRMKISKVGVGPRPSKEAALLAQVGGAGRRVGRILGYRLA